MTTLYPDQLNPFDDEEEEDDKNPFKSDDEEEACEAENSAKNGDPQSSVEVPVRVPVESPDTHVRCTPISNSGESPHQLTISPLPRRSVPGEKVVISGSADGKLPDLSKPKPSPLPRRLLAQNSTDDKERPQSAVEIRSPISPLPPRIDGSVGDLSTTPIKRRAPSIPSCDGSIPKTLPSPEKSPLSVGKKKIAPLPPVTVQTNANLHQRRKSSADEDTRTMEERLQNLKMSSGQSATSLTARRDSSASTSSGVRSSLTPDSQSLNQHLTSSVEDMEEQQYLDLMQTLRAEHQSIESELRDLMAIPSKLRSAAQIAREERLMKDLMENVKRRDELEDEDDESELQKTLGDAGNPGGQPKKMKKKGKFKIKKLLGVK